MQRIDEYVNPFGSFDQMSFGLFSIIVILNCCCVANLFRIILHERHFYLSNLGKDHTKITHVINLNRVITNDIAIYYQFLL